MNNLLIVDDEEAIRENLKDYFEDEGFKIFDFENPFDAIKFVESKTVKIDYAIIDLRLPDMNGAELIIKLNLIDESIKFIIHTGSTNFNISQALHNIGMTQDDVFFKPVYDMTVLKDALLREK